MIPSCIRTDITPHLAYGDNQFGHEMQIIVIGQQCIHRYRKEKRRGTIRIAAHLGGMIGIILSCAINTANRKTTRPVCPWHRNRFKLSDYAIGHLAFCPANDP